jgi:hypothetical protein
LYGGGTVMRKRLILKIGVIILGLVSLLFVYQYRATLSEEQIIEIVKKEKGEVYIVEVEHKWGKYIVDYIYPKEDFGYSIEVDDKTGEFLEVLAEIKIIVD